MELGVVPLVVQPMILLYDTNGVMAQPKELRNHKNKKKQKKKYIERKYHLIHEIVQRGDIVVEKIPSINNPADPFTKTLT